MPTTRLDGWISICHCKWDDLVSQNEMWEALAAWLPGEIIKNPYSGCQPRSVKTKPVGTEPRDYDTQIRFQTWWDRNALLFGCLTPQGDRGGRTSQGTVVGEGRSALVLHSR
jgi:hypothetical protein